MKKDRAPHSLTCFTSTITSFEKEKQTLIAYHQLKYTADWMSPVFPPILNLVLDPCSYIAFTCKVSLSVIYKDSSVSPLPFMTLTSLKNTV